MKRVRPERSRKACWARESEPEPCSAASGTSFAGRRSEPPTDAQRHNSSAEEFFCLVEEVGVERPHRSDRLGQGYADDLGTAQRDHPAEFLAERQAGRMNAQASAEHAVVGAGSAAALQVAECDDAR